MHIRIDRGISEFKFPYGLLQPEHREFLIEHEGEVFEAERTCMNYYTLSNGVKVHVYNAYETKNITPAAQDV